MCPRGHGGQRKKPAYSLTSTTGPAGARASQRSWSCDSSSSKGQIQRHARIPAIAALGPSDHSCHGLSSLRGKTRVPLMHRRHFARPGTFIYKVHHLCGISMTRAQQATGEHLSLVLQELKAVLAELVESTSYMPPELREVYAAAWDDLEKRGYIDQAIAALRGPAVDDLLAAHGLVGPQRVAKTESLNAAAEERNRRGGWGPFKALLGYFDSILGSLAGVLPWLDAVKEFKEISEASAELANEARREDVSA